MGKWNWRSVCRLICKNRDSGDLSEMAIYRQLMRNLDGLSMHLPTTLLCALRHFGEARPSLDEDQLTML
jgi:hypothetical protein